MSAKGIFCLEGDWSGRLDRLSTVEPILKLLRRWDPYYVPYAHRDVATREEFDLYVRKWTQRSAARFPILYLAFHGDDSTLYIGDRRRKSNTVTIGELGAMLEGRCDKRVIFFGSCETLALHGHSINAFVRRTGVLAVCGYRRKVDWLDATTFELVALGAIQLQTLTRPGLRAARRRILASAGALAKRLEFRMVIPA